MRVLSDWRLRGVLGLVVVAGGLGWMASSQLPAHSPLSSWPARVLTALSPTATPAALKASLLADYGKTPLHFEPNVGQTRQDVKFLAQGGGYTLFLTSNEAVVRLSRDGDKPAATVLRARLEGANPSPRVSGQQPQASYSNYFIGNDPQQWHSGVAHYGRVHYSSVWPGIDLVYYGNQRQLEYDFIVQPGANPGLIRMSWHGADNLFIDNDGNLIAETSLGPVRQHKPVIYQTIKGQRKTVEGRYALSGRQVSFALGDYDHKAALVIDPVLVYSTYLGGGSLEEFNLTGIAVTARGSAYVAGYTDDTNYPITDGALQPSRKAGHNTVVSRLGYTGASLVYSTFIGGSRPDMASSIAVNAAGEAFVAGSTQATDFPLTPSPGLPYKSQNTNSNGTTGFITKLAADGKSIIYSTYLGGNGSLSVGGDHITAIALDASGQAHVTGDTDSTDFPHTTVPGKPAGSRSGFVSILNASGESLVASTYLGGNGNEQPNALSLAGGDIFVAGTTTSTNLMANSNAGGKDAFVSRLSSDLQTLRYTRYIGGSNDDEGRGVAADSSGNVWIAGSSKSSNFPVMAPPAGLPSEGSKVEGTETAFLARLDNSGVPSYSTFLGISGKATALGLSSGGQVVVAGQMTAAFNPLHPLSEVITTDSSNAFIRVLGSDGSLLISTPLGGSHSDETITALALDPANGLYVTGNTRSNNFPQLNPAYPFSGEVASNGFVSKITNGPRITLLQSSSSTGINKDFTLSWETIGASSCRWDDESIDVTDPAKGSRTLQKSSTALYEFTLTCQSSSNGPSSATATVKVVAAPTASLSVTPNPIAIGETGLISWVSTDASSCYITGTIADPDGGDDIVKSIAVVLNGSNEYEPTIAGIQTYTLTCAGPGSSTSATATAVVDIKGRPTLSLQAIPSADPLVLGVSGSNTVTYKWSGENVDSCTATGPLTGAQPTSAAAMVVTMTAAGAQTLKLICTGPSGLQVTKSVTVSVLDPGSPPAITSFTSTAPPGGIALYRSFTLNWAVSNAQSCSASSTAGAGTTEGPGSWTGSKALSGSATVTPQAPAAHSYTLTCTGPGGPSSSTIPVQVAMPDPAKVSALLLSPSTISLGQSTTVSWQSTNADSCVASGDWSGDKSTSGSTLLKPTRQGSLAITLTCTGYAGSDSSNGHKTVTLTVTAPASTGEDTGGGDSGGGPVDWLLLSGLALLGLARRQQR
ncbi:MAG: SBBP repeat-containing protein [Moraxellaceae bacterium]